MGVKHTPAPALPPVPAVTLAAMARQWWGQIAIYLPVLIMGLLALGSYWVLLQAPPPAVPGPPRPVSEAPDYFMRDFALRTFGPDGRLKSQLGGTELRRLPLTQTIEVDDVRLHAVDAHGRSTKATAQHLSTNEAQSFYTLTGNVVIIRAAHEQADGQLLPRLEFRGQAITYRVAEGLLESDQPVLLLRGADRIEADRLRYSDATRQAELRGRVRATLQPRR